MSKRYKYPRTFHLPWSPGASSDDKVLPSVDHFQGKRVVVTEKMDGENTTLYRDGMHARSIDGRHHPSRDWVKKFWSERQHDLPEGWRICGENLYARHSIAYSNLPSYFLGFSAWDENNTCLSWSDTVELFELLGIVPVCQLGNVHTFDENWLRNGGAFFGREDSMEGYVVRVAGSFPFERFSENVAKYVRPNHVQTDEHWMSKEIVPNGLARF